MLAKLHRGEPVDIPEDRTIFVDTYVISPENLEEVGLKIAEKLKLLEKYQEFGN